MIVRLQGEILPNLPRGRKKAAPKPWGAAVLLTLRKLGINRAGPLSHGPHPMTDSTSYSIF